MSIPQSQPHIFDVLVHRGAQASPEAPFDLLIDIPHGATTREDFEELASKLKGPLPPNLIDFFFVNTDSGAPELSDAVARQLVADNPTLSVLTIRCRVPRTFLDCNRRIDASDEEFKAGRVDPGFMPWVQDEADKALCLSRYQAYLSTVRTAREALSPRGAMVLMHTYSPKTVGVSVGWDIVEKLHWAYTPEMYATWPERPSMDIIGRDLEGKLHAPADVMAALAGNLAALGMRLGDSETYPLHSSTVGWEHAMALPERCICIEARRDLFHPEGFKPFVESAIDGATTEALARPVTDALKLFWAA